MRIGVKPGQWGWRFDELTSAWERVEGLGFDVLSCFDHVSAAPTGYAAWDAPTLLAVMAARTSRIAISVDVLNVALRHPFLLGGQLAVVQAASSGRLEVGLGAGSPRRGQHDHRALGIAFPRLAERRALLESCLGVLPALWRGERVTDAALGLQEASLGPIDIAVPPLIVGGTSDALIETAVTRADGWNASLEQIDDYAARARFADELCARHARTRPLRRHVQVFADELDPDAAHDLVAELETHGATTVIFVFHKRRDRAAIEELARRVL
jgi:alkanesulfonate monooxygenase SsuD/methylene tetrahydromethanopterin reductase-like flavin-dependent oxidoreductase (luciferase family)